MHVASLEVKNFRCFTSYKYQFSRPLTIIEGPNGSGKTSLLEALHYACYGKSFRTSSTDELIQQAANTLFIKIELEHDAERHIVQVGYSDEAKSIKINGKKITNYKELLTHYRAITITEDDMLLVKGAPEFRRTFLDQAVIMQNPEAAALYRNYRKALKQRSALLINDQAWHQESYELWTEKLWDLSAQVVAHRKQFLARLERELCRLLAQFFPELPPVTLTYQLAVVDHDMQTWIQLNAHRERHARRTLFGPHLDDMALMWNGHHAKVYASRGQQKLLAVLLKIAHFFMLKDQPIILLDDFMTDFDDARLYALLDLFMQKKVHIICTVPTSNSLLAQYLEKHGAERIQLL